MKNIIIIILVAVIVAGLTGGGVYLWQNNKTIQLRAQDQVIKNALNEKIKNLEAEKSELGNQLQVLEERRQKSYVAYSTLKEYFVPELSNTNTVYIAILLNNKKICEDINGGDKQLCYDVFENNCLKYKYPNRELCERLAITLSRNLTQSEIISHCNNKEKIEDDLTQAHCFQHFAEATNNMALCDEICKSPINNTNCRALCRDENDQPIDCQGLYIQECKNLLIK